MYQTFDVKSRPEDGPPRLATLRAQMTREGLDGYLIPRADAHQGEYVAPHDERLQWLTGFTGSAGFCAVLDSIAGVFIDGRYRVQVKSQVDLKHFTPVPWPETRLADWLIEHAPNGAKIGFDPWLHTIEEIENLVKANHAMHPTDNLIDCIWHDQPVPPDAPAFVQPIEFAGETHADKRARIAEQLRDAGQAHAVLTLPDSISWLLNLRGADIARNPVVQGFAILHDDATLDLFARPGKLDGLVHHLGPDVALRADTDFAAALEALTGSVRIDPKSAPFAVATLLTRSEVTISHGNDPCILPKARKNTAEIDGSRSAHLRDGAAMVEFLCWLDREAPKGTLTEIDVVKALEGFRRATNALREISFETISGAGPNGAIVHYRVTEDSNRAVKPGELLLVDSGGQYRDGTTDITRTIAIGDVGGDEKSCFTRVLQGMIAMSRARWPKGLAGQHLDAIARYPLWLAGQDYDHGTGHGVGAYLSVHEGPARLSKISDVPIESGMILSNEPGYYREGAFGIRIENLLVVTPAPDLPGADARDMLAFETLTFVPIDTRLIDIGALSRAERDWLNAYHADTFEKLSPRLSDDARAWLGRATAPI